MSKHTRGPWNAVQETPRNRWTIFGSNSSGKVCRVPTSEANANLIAAAPDLLSELEAMTKAFTRCAELHGSPEAFVEITTAKARAVIAKAKGE